MAEASSREQLQNQSALIARVCDLTASASVCQESTRLGPLFSWVPERSDGGTEVQGSSR